MTAFDIIIRNRISGEKKEPEICCSSYFGKIFFTLNEIEEHQKNIALENKGEKDNLHRIMEVMKNKLLELK